jgi:hypothetical protein
MHDGGETRERTMEKVLDAGKNATYLLIGVCAALMVAALTEDGGESLEGSIEEVQGLASLRPEEMARTLNMWRFESRGGLRPNLTEQSERIQSSLGSALYEAAVRSGSAVVDSALSVQVEFKGTPAALPFVPRSDATLGELRAYLAEGSPYRVLAVPPGPLQASLASRLVQERQFWHRITRIEVSINFELEHWVGFPGDSETLDYCDGVRELRMPPSAGAAMVFIGEAPPQPGNYDRGQRIPNIPVVLVSVKDEHAVADLLRYGPRQFASASAGELNHASHVWDAIEGLTPTEALASLRQRASDSAQAISVGGLSIRREHATVGGPLIIASLLFYILSHMKRGQELCRSNSIDAGAAWQAIYPHWTGQIVAIGTTIFLPAISCGLLLWTTRGVGWGGFGLGAELVVVGLGLWTTVEALRLRGQLNPGSSPPGGKVADQGPIAVPTFGARAAD